MVDMWGNSINLNSTVTFRVGKETLTGKVVSYDNGYVEVLTPEIGKIKLRNIDIRKV